MEGLDIPICDTVREWAAAGPDALVGATARRGGGCIGMTRIACGRGGGMFSFLLLSINGVCGGVARRGSVGFGLEVRAVRSIVRKLRCGRGMVKVVGTCGF